MLIPFTTSSRIILGFVGLLYLLLGISCAVAPEKLGKSMGYTFNEKGVVEFVVLYGGLEIGMGLAMIFASMSKVLFPGVYFMTMVVSLALLLTRVWMLISRGMGNKLDALLLIELAIAGALLWPFLRSKFS